MLIDVSFELVDFLLESFTFNLEFRVGLVFLGLCLGIEKETALRFHLQLQELDLGLMEFADGFTVVSQVHVCVDLCLDFFKKNLLINRIEGLLAVFLFFLLHNVMDVVMKVFDFLDDYGRGLAHTQEFILGIFRRLGVADVAEAGAAYSLEDVAAPKRDSGVLQRFGRVCIIDNDASDSAAKSRPDKEHIQPSQVGWRIRLQLLAAFVNQGAVAEPDIYGKLRLACDCCGPVQLPVDPAPAHDSAISRHKFARPMWLVIFPLAFIAAAVDQPDGSLPVLLPLKPRPFVVGSIGPPTFANALLDVVEPAVDICIQIDSVTVV